MLVFELIISNTISNSGSSAELTHKIMSGGLKNASPKLCYYSTNMNLNKLYTNMTEMIKEI
jgi:hypothetical protein